MAIEIKTVLWKLINLQSPTVALAILAEQVLDVFCILPNALFIAVVTVDKYDEMAGVIRNFCPLIVAGRRSYTSLCITIDGQSLYVEHPTAYPLVWLTLTSDAECQRVAHEFLSIKATDAIAIGNGSQIHQVNQSVELIELFPLKDATNKCLRGRTVSGGVFATSFINATCGGYAGYLLQRLRSQFFTEPIAKGVNLLPKRFAIRAIDHHSIDTSPDKLRTNLLYLL